MVEIFKECWKESPFEVVKLVGSAVLGAGLLYVLTAILFTL